MNKKLISICALIAMAALVIAGASMAYFSDTIETKGNVLISGNVDISISEIVADGAITDLKPGVAIERELKITCEGTTGAYVRIKTESADGVYSFSVDTASDTKWVNSGNGIYTYTEALKKGESVSITVSMTLSNKVEYDETSGNYVLRETVSTSAKEYTKDDILKAYSITAEAIQTTGFATYDVAFAAMDNQNAAVSTSATE